jgi:hypothetical protein
MGDGDFTGCGTKFSERDAQGGVCVAGSLAPLSGVKAASSLEAVAAMEVARRQQKNQAPRPAKTVAMSASLARSEAMYRRYE